jgi:O-acetyl-ADP-ribose deacetylase (regulator of RNase III)
VAVENNLSSISFPSISTGAYGYPVTEAAKVAISTVASLLKEGVTSIKEVVFVLFDSATFKTYSSVLGEIVGR